MTFGDWQQLTPEKAAHEVRQRAGASLSEAQQRATFAVLPTEEVLVSAFAASAPGTPLRGIPYLLKDLFDVTGLPTFAGSSFLPEVRATPSRDSGVVRDFASVGAVMAGKTHLFEFAWGLTGENAHYGDCDHPRFPGRTSGGSSSGSAAAVAAEVVPLALGTDTGGSIRVPAAFCGIFGYRGVPGDGWITDAVPLAPSFDTTGWFTRTASDMRQVISALVGLRTNEKQTPKGCYLEMPGLDADVAEACREAACELTTPADSTTQSELLAKFAPAAETYGVLAGLESWKIHRKWAEKHRNRYGPLLQDRLERAKGISPAQVAAVDPSYEAIRVAWTKFFLTYDFLIMPATPFPALTKADCTQANRLRMMNLTTPASLGALPVITVPVRLPSGMSTGLQVIMNHPQSPVASWLLDVCRQSSD